MADIKDIGGAGGVLGGIAGAIAFLFAGWEFLWKKGDREERKLASDILSCEIVREAVATVALAAIVDSKEFVAQNLYNQEQATNAEKLEKLHSTVEKLNEYVRSDQMAEALARAIDGAETRRMMIRRKEDRE